MSKNNRYNRDFRPREDREKEVVETVKESNEKTVETKDPITEELKKEETVAEEPVTNEPEIKKGHVIAKLLNVRSEPQKGDNLIGQITEGTDVDIITKGGLPEGWIFVKGNMLKGVSITGYVMSEYIKED